VSTGIRVTHEVISAAAQAAAIRMPVKDREFIIRGVYFASSWQETRSMSMLLPMLVVLLQAATADCTQSTKRPLFECVTPLEFTLELPVKTLLRQAKNRPVLDGKLHYVDQAGEQLVLDVQVTTRGNSRLDMCSFPPLSLFLDKKQVKGTIFAGQKKLKIVTQCRTGSNYLDYLRQEYGIYKAYNVVADPSFRVRMLNITFRDSQMKKKDDVQVAFFIESPREVAARSGLEPVKLNRIPPHQLDEANSSIYELFQFLIANTDWSKVKGPGDADCCHNGKVLREPGSESGWFVLPYDFDQAGLINTPYAVPSEQLPISRVSQRLFRGRCEYIDYLDDTIELFNRERQAIETALASGDVSDRKRKRQSDFVARFFEIINDPKKRKREIDDRCVGPRVTSSPR